MLPLKEHTILAVDDDIAILEIIKLSLSKEKYQVYISTGGIDALEKVESLKPDLILMDIDMPGMDGIETCRRINEEYKQRKPHIICLSAHTEEYIEIAAFNAGANDFIIKPIRLLALSKRIASVFNSYKEKNKEPEVISLRGISLNNSSYIALKDNNPIALTKIEFKLLYYFIQNSDKVFSRDHLITKVWGSNVLVGVRTIDVHVKNIREKLAGNYIITIKNIGYKFESQG